MSRMQNYLRLLTTAFDVAVTDQRVEFAVELAGQLLEWARTQYRDTHVEDRFAAAEAWLRRTELEATRELLDRRGIRYRVQTPSAEERTRYRRVDCAGHPLEWHTALVFDAYQHAYVVGYSGFSAELLFSEAGNLLGVGAMGVGELPRCRARRVPIHYPAERCCATGCGDKIKGDASMNDSMIEVVFPDGTMRYLGESIGHLSCVEAFEHGHSDYGFPRGILEWVSV